MQPCKEWQGARQRNGYGVRRYKGKAWRVHRAAWDEQVGPIPPGMMVLHHCDNRPCFEITHLFLGTAKDNTDDMRDKGRMATKANGYAWPTGEDRPHKLTDAEVVEIRARYVRQGHPNSYDLAAEYGVSRVQIGNIVNYRQRVAV